MIASTLIGTLCCILFILTCFGHFLENFSSSCIRFKDTKYDPHAVVFWLREERRHKIKKKKWKCKANTKLIEKPLLETLVTINND